MHIWLTIYNDRLSATDINQGFAAKIQGIPTLTSNQFVCYELDGFSFFSWSPTHRTSKTYLNKNGGSVYGYSGTIIDNSGNLEDLRHIDHVMAKVQDVARLSGQFSIFQICKNTFSCWGDNLGSHKVFYVERDHQILVSNNLDLLVQVGRCEIDVKQFVLQKVVADSGGHIGYKTYYKGVSMLPENALLTIKEGKLVTSQYTSLRKTLYPKRPFDENLNQTVHCFKNSAEYLRRYHEAVVPLSGGFDSRVVLAMFWASQGKAIHTLTYNRQSNLDFIIASKLSKDFQIPHFKISLDPNKDQKLIAAFDDEADGADIFNFLIRLKSREFYNAQNIKVVLSGNGGDTDWAYHFSKNVEYSATDFNQLVSGYSEKFYENEFLIADIKEEGKKEVKQYMENKYGSFATRKNFVQLFGSGIFHLERFRNQGMGFSQRSATIHDTFHPFGTSDFLKTVFSAQKENIMRGNRNSIHHLLYNRLTDQHAPYAPLLRENSWHDGLRKAIQNLLPLYAKVLWKLQGGDVNTVLRRKYGFDQSNKYKEIILRYPDSDIWDYIKRDELFDKLHRNEAVPGIRLSKIANYLNR